MDIRNSALRLALGLSLAAAAIAHAGPVKVIRFGLTGNKYDKPFPSGGLIGLVQQQRALEDEFAKDGITVEWSFYKGTGPAVNESVANGKLDFASYGDLPTIVGKAGGLPTKVIIPSSVTGGKNFILVQGNSSFKSSQDLIGKRISFQKGTYFHLLWNRYAKYNLKVSEKDFKIYSLTSGDQEVALASGQVDAIVTTSLDLVDRGSARILETLDLETLPKLSNFGNILATESFIKDHPDLVQRFVNAYVRVAVKVLNEEHRADFIKVGTLNGTSDKTARFNLVKNLEFAYAPVFDDYYYKKLQAAISDSREFNLIRKPIDPKEWVAASFLDKAVRDQGQEERWNNLRKDKLAGL